MLKPFFVWQDKILVKIQPEEVIALVTVGNYTKIFLPDKSFYMVRSTLSNALKKLPPNLFIKIHRAYVVSVNHIDNIDKDHLLAANDPVPIGKQYYKSLIDKLNIIE